MKRLGAARIVIQIRSSLCSCRRADFLEASRNYAGIAEGVASLVGADLARAMPLSERDTSYELSKLHDLSKLVIEILPSRPPQTPYTPNPFPRQRKVA